MCSQKDNAPSENEDVMASKERREPRLLTQGHMSKTTQREDREWDGAGRMLFLPGFTRAAKLSTEIH